MWIKNIINIFKPSVILRPSIVFGPEDKFFNTFASLTQFLPALPLIGGGKKKFSPIYVWFYQWMPDLLFQTGLVKAVLAFSLVLIPTIFMGATLPIMAKYFMAEETSVGKQVGYLLSLIHI